MSDPRARTWTAQRRAAGGNDTDLPAALNATTTAVDRAKLDKDIAAWLPPAPSAHCRYATDWLQTKYKWGLSVDPAEKTALLRRCGDTPIEVPTRARPGPAPTRRVMRDLATCGDPGARLTVYGDGDAAPGDAPRSLVLRARHRGPATTPGGGTHGLSGTRGAGRATWPGRITGVDGGAVQGYRFVHGPPAVQDYLVLRQRAGLTPTTGEQAAAGLADSWAACHAVEEDSALTVGMGRVIGDGGWSTSSTQPCSPSTSAAGSATRSSPPCSPASAPTPRPGPTSTSWPTHQGGACTPGTGAPTPPPPRSAWHSA